MSRILNIICFSLVFFFACSSSAFAANPGMGGASFDQVQQAAVNGDPDAQYALGYMYYYGKGVTRDEQEATQWIQKAAAQGQPQAIKAINLLGLNAHPDTTASTSVKPHTPNGSNTASVAAITQQSGNQPAAPAQVTSQPAQSEPSAPQARPHPKPYAPSVLGQRAESTGSQSADEKRLLNTPANYYTIQLLGAYYKEDIEKLIRAHHIEAKSLYYKTSFQGRPWYVLVYGVYKSDGDAKAEISRLPGSMASLRPWVKSFNSVHHAIRTGVE